MPEEQPTKKPRRSRRGGRRDGRKHVPSKLMRESLVSREFIRQTQIEQEFRVYPDYHLVKIGGKLIDRGKDVLLPLAEEIGRLSNLYKIIPGVGGGVRERHTFSIGIDLGLPTAGLATVAGAIPEQNALMIQILMAKYGAIRVPKEHFEELPLYLNSGAIPVIVAMPPYLYWEQPAEKGRIPPHGTDTGMYLLAETFGTQPVIYLKDVDGLYTADPKRNKNARLIPRVGARELLKMNLPELPIEKRVLELMTIARNATEIRIVSGLKPENLRKALKKEKVGTTIFKDT